MSEIPLFELLLDEFFDSDYSTDKLSKASISKIVRLSILGFCTMFLFYLLLPNHDCELCLPQFFKLVLCVNYLIAIVLFFCEFSILIK